VPPTFTFNYNNTTSTETDNFWDFHNTYTWDTLNRVTTVKQESPSNVNAASWSVKNQQTRTAVIGYFADGAIQTISRTQGAAGFTSSPILSTYVSIADGLKNEGRLASITQSGFSIIGLGAGDCVYAYGYDDQGRIASMTTPAGTRTYAYDSFDQVTGATATTALPAESYSYDTNGNRTTGAGATSTVIGAYNRITDDGTYTYVYDKEGNRTRRENKVRPPTTDTTTIWFEIYTWDYRERLVGVTKYNRDGAWQQYVAYDYDGLDQRIRKTVKVPGQSSATVTLQERYLYDHNVLDASMEEVVLVINELTAGSAYQQVSHRFMNGPEIDQVFSDERPGNSILWYLSDQQNTVRDVANFVYGTANNAAVVRNHLKYGSFGNVTADNPTTATANDGTAPGIEGSVTTTFSPQRSFTGREPDASTGLIYYRARWFDPQLGRFISEDPIGCAAGDANLSRYVGNSTPNGTQLRGQISLIGQSNGKTRMSRTVQNAAGTVTAKQRFLYDTNVVDPSFDEIVIVLDETLNITNPTLQEQHVFLNGPEIDQVFADQNSATTILWYLSDHQNTVRDVATMTYGDTANTANANMPTVRNHLEYDSFGNVTAKASGREKFPR
jgi:RHS repeat-associated protein